jgi:hypothetical protein
MEIPLITYLVSSGPEAVSKKIDPRSLFDIPGPPWLEEAVRLCVYIKVSVVIFALACLYCNHRSKSGSVTQSPVCCPENHFISIVC